MKQPSGEFEKFEATSHTTGTLPLPDEKLLAQIAASPPIWAVVFAGGIGSRFWPLATPATPKPVLPLVDGRPLGADSVGRLDPLIPADRVLVLTSADIAPVVRAALPAVPSSNILVEERPMGTAAALAWGVSEVRRRGGDQAIVCALHADLASAFPAALRDAIKDSALISARDHAIVAIGARPTRVEPSFGYMTVGAPVQADFGLERGGVADVTQFTEKPGPLAADALIKAGALWHSGIIVAAAQELLDSLKLYVPEVSAGLPALAKGDVASFITQARSISIEHGLLERVGRLLVIAPDIGWDDVGTWAGLRRVRELDDEGNGGLGDVHFVDATGNVVHAGEGTVVLFGVSQLLVVTRPGLTFVTTLERAADLKPLLDSLPGSARINPGSIGS
jgi:mannose-1-phosphate guanylyltransferase